MLLRYRSQATQCPALVSCGQSLCLLELSTKPTKMVDGRGFRSHGCDPLRQMQCKLGCIQGSNISATDLERQVQRASHMFKVSQGPP